MADSDMFRDYINEYEGYDPHTRDCTSTKPGHCSSWVLGKIANRTSSLRPAELVAVDGNWLTLYSEENIHRVWVHSKSVIAMVLTRLLTQDNVELEYSPRPHILSMTVRDGSGLDIIAPVNVATEPSACGAESPDTPW